MRAFLVFGDGVEEVGDLNFPRLMFHIHLRRGRDDGLVREVAIRTSPQPEVVKEELYDTATSSPAQWGFDSWTMGLVSNYVEQSLDSNPFQEQAEQVPG